MSNLGYYVSRAIIQTSIFFVVSYRIAGFWLTPVTWTPRVHALLLVLTFLLVGMFFLVIHSIVEVKSEVLSL